MRCPYCNKEMLSGYIPNDDQPVQWLPDGERPSLLAYTTAEKGVTLMSKYALLIGYKATAFYCKECKIVIAPIKSN